MHFYCFDIWYMNWKKTVGHFNSDSMVQKIETVLQTFQICFY